MPENKTVRTKESAAAFIKAIEDPAARGACEQFAKLMRKATGKRAKMWGASIVGFGEYHYKYASGREGDFMVTGFSPRKQNLTVYIMPGFKKYAALLKKLGKHKHSSSCLYINKLEDINLKVLEQLIERSVRDMKKMYPTNLA
jgi:hypothetical protein